MSIGISSSCFYPLETEKSLVRVGETGARVTEIFFNSPSEIEKPFLKELNAIKDHYGMKIASIHPFMSFAEGFYIFSNYERRFYDSLDMYSKFFEAAAELDAKIFVLHGAKRLGTDIDLYAERLFRLGERAKGFGVQVAHENVVNYVGAECSFMTYMKKQLGDGFKTVLDIKQARRSGADAFEFIEKLGTSIIHVHVSDCRDGEDCLPPGEGCFDFVRLFAEMKNCGYSGDYIIELYSQNFKSDAQLKAAKDFLERI